VKQWVILVWSMVLLLMVQATNAHEGHSHETHPDVVTSSLAVSVTADYAGRVWMAQVKQGQVWVLASDDAGQHFNAGIAVNATPMNVAADAESRPMIAVDANGGMYVIWTELLKKNQASYLWFARSIDGGKHFEAPYLVHQHRAEMTHRYGALQVAADGAITVAWLDKRDMLAAKAAGKTYEGAAIYYAVSRDQGKSFGPEQKLADHSCECCRIAMASKPDGTVAMLWRHVFDGNERDHAMAEIGPQGHPVLVRASYGHWKLDGCPHHGAALAVGEGFGYHLAYFDGAGDKPGLRIARMDGQAWVTSPPRRFGDAKKNAGHPALLSVGDQVWLAWQEHDSSGADIVAMASSDGGRTWDAPLVMLHSNGKLDYPQWLTLQGRATLVINSADKGLQLIPFNH